jgi:hypothetical protein
MTFTPTNRTAALAGAWCAIGIIPFDAWEEHNKLATVTSHNIAFAAFAVVFLVVPAYFLVFGHGSKAFGLTWFSNQEERNRYLVLFKRILSWFLAAGAVMALSSLLVS